MDRRPPYRYGLDNAISAVDWTLLPGALVLTRAELSSAGTVQLSQRTIETSLPGLVRGPTLGYTYGMKTAKTAVSLPDHLFRAAERYAKMMRKPRSQLYAQALTEFLARHTPEEVTEAMNRVVEKLGESGPDPFLARAARRVLEHTEW